MIKELEDVLKKNYPLLYDTISKLTDKEITDNYAGIFDTIDSVMDNLELISDIEDDMVIEAMEDVDKSDSFFDKEYTDLELLLKEDNERTTVVNAEPVPLYGVLQVSLFATLVMLIIRMSSGFEDNYPYVIITSIMCSILYPILIIVSLKRYVNFRKWL